MRLFLSYCSKPDSRVEDFVAEVAYCIRRISGVGVYFHPEERCAGEFPPQIASALQECETFCLFVSAESGNSDWQDKELGEWREARGGNSSGLIVIPIDDVPIPLAFRKTYKGIADIERVAVSLSAPDEYHRCAVEILDLLRVPRALFDDLPLDLLASYEKDIINKYVAAVGGQLSPQLVERGYPRDWPTINRLMVEQALVRNPLDPPHYGVHRADDSAICVDARLSASTMRPLSFLEAGPRRTIVDPRNELRVGVLVSGGIAPGLNALLSAIIDRHRAYEFEWRRGVNHEVTTQQYWDYRRASAHCVGPVSTEPSYWTRELSKSM